MKVNPTLSVEERNSILESDYCKGEVEVCYNRIFDSLQFYYKKGGMISIRLSGEVPTASIFSPIANRWGYFSGDSAKKVHDKILNEVSHQLVSDYLTKKQN